MELLGFKPAENSKKIYACHFEGCTSVFDRPYRLTQHRLVHANVKPFVCKEPNCEKAYTSKSHLDRHIKSVHKETEHNVLYCCPKCMKKYVNRQNLKRHIKVSHIDNNKPFCCALCRVYFKKKHQLRAHMYIHNGLKPFRCPMCDRDFITLYEKKKHMRNHKIYQCEHCDNKYTRWTELMQHKRIDHVSPEYICHDCGKVFKERGHIIRHVKKHMPNTPVTIFFCPYENCTRHYSRNSNLKQHILVKHEGLTFDCLLCGAKLSTKAKLNEHIERHNRPEVVVKVHKTLATGRKKRKDAGTIRYETAMRLAGIVKQKIDESISRLCTDNLENIAETENCFKTEEIEQRLMEKFSSQKMKTDFSEKESLSTTSTLSRQNKMPAVKDMVELSFSDQRKDSQEIRETNISNKPIKNAEFLEKFKPVVSNPLNSTVTLHRPSTSNRPSTLIELLKRVDTSTSNQTRKNKEILENVQASMLGRRTDSIDLNTKVDAVASDQINSSDVIQNEAPPGNPNTLMELLRKTDSGEPKNIMDNVNIKIEPNLEHTNNTDDCQEKIKDYTANQPDKSIEIQIKTENDTDSQSYRNTDLQTEDSVDRTQNIHYDIKTEIDPRSYLDVPDSQENIEDDISDSTTESSNQLSILYQLYLRTMSYQDINNYNRNK